MIYQFYFKDVRWAIIEEFVRFCETLKSFRHIAIDYDITNVARSDGFVSVACSQEDFEEAFWWLKRREIKAQVIKSTLKDYNMGRKQKI